MTVGPRSRVPATAVLFALAASVACGAPLDIIDVTPATIAPGGTIAIAGTGFGPGMSAHLQAPGLDVELLDVSVDVSLDGATGGATGSASNVGALHATLPAAAPEGTYDVVVERDGRSATATGALTVQAGALRVSFLDVGQGDGTLLVGPDGSTMLIDGGNRDATSTIFDAFRTRAGGHLDALALTHTDADHLGGLVGLSRGLDGTAGTDDDIVPTTRWIGHEDTLCDSALCDEMRRLRGWPWSIPDVGTTLDLGGATVEVLARDGRVGGTQIENADTENERSLAVVVRFAGRSLLIAGDLTGGGLGDADLETPLAQLSGPVDVFRASHHGSATSSASTAVTTLAPRAIILSLGTNNPFCHPASPALHRLELAHAPIFATGDGMVDVTGSSCDGPTPWPVNARHGLGTIDMVIAADGSITIDDETIE